MSLTADDFEKKCCVIRGQALKGCFIIILHFIQKKKIHLCKSGQHYEYSLCITL